MSGNSTTALFEGRLLLNQFELVAPTTVAGTFYGIAFTLFCLYVHALAPRLVDKDRKTQARFMLGCSIIVMICGLYFLVSNAWVTQDAFIKHASVLGGPYSYILSTLHTPVIIIGLTSQVIVDTYTSAIQIWRVWIIWSATEYAKYVIVLPSLCFLTWTSLRLRTVVLETTLPLQEVVHLDSKTHGPENGIQAATTIFCTALIAVFLIFEQWRHGKLIGKAQGSSGYMRVVAMLIESYALESIWLLISIAIVSPPLAFFGETGTYIEIIAYFLVQYRVASGTAYETQRERSRISSLHWNHSSHAVTQFGGTLSAGDGDPQVSVKPDAPEALPIASMA